MMAGFDIIKHVTEDEDEILIWGPTITGENTSICLVMSDLVLFPVTIPEDILFRPFLNVDTIAVDDGYRVSKPSASRGT
jgi:hypothetical protein